MMPENPKSLIGLKKSMGLSRVFGLNPTYRTTRYGMYGGMTYNISTFNGIQQNKMFKFKDSTKP
jgi:hypothetical protein